MLLIRILVTKLVGWATCQACRERMDRHATAIQVQQPGGRVDYYHEVCADNVGVEVG